MENRNLVQLTKKNIDIPESLWYSQFMSYL